jgi:hypothetical protein
MVLFICCPASLSSLRKMITSFDAFLYNIESIEVFYVEIIAGDWNYHNLQLIFQMSVWKQVPELSSLEQTT